MDIRAKLGEIIVAAIAERFGDRVPAEEAAKAALVEMPRDSAHGDLATSACLKLARALKMAPLAAAKELAGPIKAACDARIAGYVDSVEVVAPGFMNFHLGLGYLRSIVGEIAKGGYGRSNLGAGARYNVEFVSANPTGPLTVAHGRQAAVGDALANILLYAGYEVAREYYLNDTGRQIKMLGASVFHFYATEAGGSYPFPEDGYHGDYIAGIGKALFEKEGKALLALEGAKAVERAGIFAADSIMEGIRKDLDEFRVRFDMFFSQREFEASGAVETLMERFRKSDLAYESEGAVWFKASEYGDEKDRVVIRSDGTFTYRTPDIAYLENKFERGFKKAVLMVGPDHHGHIITMQAAMRALGHPADAFTGLIVQFCALWRGKEKLKMSTRAGQFVTLREVFEEAGIDATRYFFTARKTDSPLDFDLELAKKQSMDNPVYYIQYMSARISGVLETAAKEERFAGEFKDGLFLSKDVDLSRLGAQEEEILRFLLQMPVAIEKAAENLEPHRLCGYLYDLAGLFHNYYAKNRFVSEDTELSRARLYFGSVLKVMLVETLGLIGITAPGKM
jgi:arginyl-tRNA synthetase